MADLRSRRDLLASLFGSLRDRVNQGVPKVDPEQALRPPGALVPDDDFLEKCTGCGDCVPPCPNSCIAMIEIGDSSLPGISPTLRPCYLCDDLPCISACSEKALEDPGSPAMVRLGIAQVDPRRCITFHGRHCERCFRACPFPKEAITMIGGRPLISSGTCTGCGLCEHACPEYPKAVTIIPERHLVPGLRVPKNEVRGG